MEALLRNLGLACLSGLLAFTCTASAQEESAEGERPRPRKDKIHGKLLEKFDEDGDGKLNEEERRAAQEFMNKMREKRGSEGRRGDRDDHHKRLLEKFDEDGDGKLNEEERKAAQAAMKDRREGEGGPGEGEGRRRKLPPEARKRIIEEFDKDGDGKLNEEERKAAQAAMKDRRGGEGRRDGEERRGGEAGEGRHPRPNFENLPPRVKKNILERFDEDGDGKLNEEEKKKAFKHMRRHRRNRGEEGDRGRPEGRRPEGEQD